MPGGDGGLDGGVEGACTFVGGPEGLLRSVRLERVSHAINGESASIANPWEETTCTGCVWWEECCWISALWWRWSWEEFDGASFPTACRYWCCW